VQKLKKMEQEEARRATDAVCGQTMVRKSNIFHNVRYISATRNPQTSHTAVPTDDAFKEYASRARYQSFIW